MKAKFRKILVYEGIKMIMKKEDRKIIHDNALVIPSMSGL
jgi:uncharacterized membrane protein YjfL (UPF0719 family)